MTQLTQFLVTQGAQSMNVTATDLAAYLAAGWTIQNIRYSEGGEGADLVTQFLMIKGVDQIRVKAASVQAYLAAGYTIAQVLYGSSQVEVESGKEFSYLDVPSLVSAEVGEVDATTVVAVFSSEIAASNYATGVTIKVDTVAKTISAAERQADFKTVHYTIPAVVFGEVVTIAYSDVTGEYKSKNDDSPLDTFAATEVTNNVAEE